MNNFRLKYRTKLFLYFFVIFFIFSSAILFILYQREKEIKTEKLNLTLNLLTDQIDNFIVNNSIFNTNNYSELIPFLNIISKDELRLSLISTTGLVLFDSFVKKMKIWKTTYHDQR